MHKLIQTYRKTFQLFMGKFKISWIANIERGVEISLREKNNNSSSKKSVEKKKPGGLNVYKIWGSQL